MVSFVYDDDHDHDDNDNDLFPFPRKSLEKSSARTRLPCNSSF